MRQRVGRLERDIFSQTLPKVNKKKRHFTDLPALWAGGQWVLFHAVKRDFLTGNYDEFPFPLQLRSLKQVFWQEHSASREAWWTTDNLGHLKPSGCFDFNAAKDVSIISTASNIAISILTLLLRTRVYSKDQMAKETIASSNHRDCLSFTHLADINSCHLVLCEWQDLLDQTSH